MFDHRGSRHDTDIGACERSWNDLKIWCPGYISPVGPLNLPFVGHTHELQYLRNLWQLIARADHFGRMSDLELECIKRRFDLLYVVYDAPDWWEKLHFEARHLRGSQNFRFLGLHTLELFALPQRDQNGFYVPMPKSWRSFEVWRPFGMANRLVLSYLSELHCRGYQLQ